MPLVTSNDMMSVAMLPPVVARYTTRASRNTRRPERLTSAGMSHFSGMKGRPIDIQVAGGTAFHAELQAQTPLGGGADPSVSLQRMRDDGGQTRGTIRGREHYIIRKVGVDLHAANRVCRH